MSNQHLQDSQANLQAIVPVGSVSPSFTFANDMGNEMGNYSKQTSTTSDISINTIDTCLHVASKASISNELKMQHISLGSVSVDESKDSKQIRMTKSSLSSSSSVGTIKRAPSLQKKIYA